MNAIRKQIKPLFLCLCIGILLLAGCATKLNSGNMEWKMKDCEVEGLEGDLMEIALISGQEFYATTGIVTGDEISERIYCVNLETKQAELIPVDIEKGYYVTDIVSRGDNGFAAFLSEMDEEVDLRRDALITADRTGEILSQRKLSEITGGEDAIRLLAMADGKLLLVTADCIYCLDETLGDVKAFKTATPVEDAVLVEGERVICLRAEDDEGGNSKARFSKLDPAKGVWEKDFELKLDRYEPVTRLTNGRGSSFFLFSTKGIYECDESGMISSVLKFAEQTLSEDIWWHLTILPEEGYLSWRNDYDSHRSMIGVLSLEVVEKQKTKIVIGGIFMDQRITRKLLEYNQTNPDVMVEIKEYECNLNSIDSMIDACNRLYADILAGNGPDVIYLQGLDRQKLIKLGYFENLDAYYDNDAEISKSDLIPSFRDAISVEGSVYYLVPYFALETLAGKTSLVGDSIGWTMKELHDLWEKNHYDIFSQSGNSAFIALTMGLVQNENVDVENFKFALEMTKTEDVNAYATERNAGLKNEKVLLALCGMTEPQYIQVVHSMFNEEAITFKGFPGVEGSGALYLIDNALAISSKSKQKDVAWNVIRPLMMEDYQSVKARNIPYFPTRLDCFEEMLREYTKKNSKYNLWLGTEMSNAEDKVVITALSNEDVEQIKKIVYATTQVYYSDSALLNIVLEEANAYFLGDKDLEEVYEVIKNRVELYRKEK